MKTLIRCVLAIAVALPVLAAGAIMCIAVASGRTASVGTAYGRRGF